jgi:hypothetical protein
VKYAIFRRDPRATLLIDDPAGFRAVLAITLDTSPSDWTTWGLD